MGQKHNETLQEKACRGTETNKSATERGISQTTPLSLPGIPEGENGSSTSPVPSLVVMVIHKDQGSVRRHKAPALSPVPGQKHKDLNLPRQAAHPVYPRQAAPWLPLL